MISLDEIRDMIAKIVPLVYEKDKKWFIEGYEKCKEMILDAGSTKLAKMFAIQYYVNKFQDEHFIMRFNDINLNFKKPLYYPGFSTHYENGVLFVHDSKVHEPKDGDRIVKISGILTDEYISNYLAFNGFDICREVEKLHIGGNYVLTDNGNPHLKAETVQLDNKKIIQLNYSVKDYKIIGLPPAKRRYIDDFFRYYKLNNDTLFVKIVTYEGLKKINLNKIKLFLPVSNIIVDIGGNPGGSTDSYIDFFRIVYGINVDRAKIKKKNGKCYVAEKAKLPNIRDKIKKPSLTIIGDLNSLSASKFFVKIAKMYIQNLKLINVYNKYVNLDELYGERKDFSKNGEYNLILPTKCFFYHNNFDLSTSI